ncbi:putative exported protein [Minicystis rosea]|nr:putative exported protein [Minicystis rosea]
MSTAARLGILVGGTRYIDPQTQKVRHCLDVLDLDAGATDPDIIPLDFLAHGFAPHPRRAEAGILEKRGPGGAYLDLATRTLLRTIAPMDGHHFYGHGAFSRNADVLFAVESDLGSNDGVISVRDPSTFAVVDTFPTYGKAPHDALLIEEGKTLAITNGGSPFDASRSARDGHPPADAADLPCICFVDVASRKLLERFPVSEPRINAGHVAVARRRAFVLVSAPRDGLPTNALGGVSIRPKGGQLRYAQRPQAVTGRHDG